MDEVIRTGLRFDGNLTVKQVQLNSRPGEVGAGSRWKGGVGCVCVCVLGWSLHRTQESSGKRVVNRNGIVWDPVVSSILSRFPV